ncbi:MAG: hypothetical protein ACREXW_15040 [Gammaproteobacteria bacterium]
MRLPILIDKPQEQQPSEPTGTEQTATTARRILVVDDNRDSAASLAMLLKLTGNETYTAHELICPRAGRPANRVAGGV